MGKRDMDEMLWRLGGQEEATGRTWQEQKSHNRRVKFWRVRQLVALSAPIVILLGLYGLKYQAEMLYCLLGILLFGILAVVVLAAGSFVLFLGSLIALRLRLWIADAWEDDAFFDLYYAVDEKDRQRLIAEISLSLVAFAEYIAVLCFGFAALL